MNDRLIRQLQEIELFEEDLFPNASEADVEQRKAETRRRQQKEEKRREEQRAKLEKLYVTTIENAIRICKKVGMTVTEIRPGLWQRDKMDDEGNKYIYTEKDLIDQANQFIYDEPDLVESKKINEEDLFPSASEEEVKQRAEREFYPFINTIKKFYAGTDFTRIYFDFVERRLTCKIPKTQTSVDIYVSPDLSDYNDGHGYYVLTNVVISSLGKYKMRERSFSYSSYAELVRRLPRTVDELTSYLEKGSLRRLFIKKGIPGSYESKIDEEDLEVLK